MDHGDNPLIGFYKNYMDEMEFMCLLQESQKKQWDSWCVEQERHRVAERNGTSLRQLLMKDSRDGK